MSYNSRLQEAWVQWLQGQGLGTYVTLTWSDEVALRDGLAYRDREGKVYGHPSSRIVALQHTRSWASRHGYDYRYFFASEVGYGRDIPHVHGMMEAMSRQERYRLWAHWFATKGLAVVLPVTDGCESYVSKYILKDDRCDTVEFSFNGASGILDLYTVPGNGGVEDDGSAVYERHGSGEGQ